MYLLLPKASTLFFLHWYSSHPHELRLCTHRVRRIELFSAIPWQRMWYICILPSIFLTDQQEFPHVLLSPADLQDSSILIIWAEVIGFGVWVSFSMCYALNRKWNLISQCSDGLLSLLSWLRKKLMESISLTISFNLYFRKKQAKHLSFQKRAEKLKYFHINLNAGLTWEINCVNVKTARNVEKTCIHPHYLS